MFEVKSRVSAVLREMEWIRSVTPGEERIEENGLLLLFKIEFCYLQLRRISELVALAVLAAHNPFPDFRTKDFVKEWNASALMKQLAKLSDVAFPRPSTVEPMGRPDGALTILYSIDDFMSKSPREDIARIYNECGDKLHSGALQFIAQQGPKARHYSMQFVVESMITYIKMLDEHTIVLPDQRVIFARVQLKSPGGVECRWLNPKPPQQSGQASRSVRPPYMP
jgi:hypothetical protein